MTNDADHEVAETRAKGVAAHMEMKSGGSADGTGSDGDTPSDAATQKVTHEVETENEDGSTETLKVERESESAEHASQDND